LGVDRQRLAPALGLDRSGHGSLFGRKAEEKEGSTPSVIARGVTPR
jgi:hypothetical protein